MPTEPTAQGTGLSTCCFKRIVLIKRTARHNHWKCSKCGKRWKEEKQW